MATRTVRICFVCLGNICRSPTAEGVMMHLVAKARLGMSIEIDSAGTGGWHAGELPDPRTRAHASARGLELTSRARQFQRADFERFDYVIAMDRNNQQALRTLAHDEKSKEKISLLRDHDPASPEGSDVPDPYYGGPEDFDAVLDLCFAGCSGLLEKIRAEHDLEAS